MGFLGVVEFGIGAVILVSTVYVVYYPPELFMNFSESLKYSIVGVLSLIGMLFIILGIERLHKETEQSKLRQLKIKKIEQRLNEKLTMLDCQLPR